MILPLSLCVGCRSSVGKFVPHVESVKAALLLICGGEFRSGNDRAFDQCTSPSPSFPLIPLMSPTLELSDPCEQMV